MVVPALAKERELFSCIVRLQPQLVNNFRRRGPTDGIDFLPGC